MIAVDLIVRDTTGAILELRYSKHMRFVQARSEARKLAKSYAKKYGFETVHEHAESRITIHDNRGITQAQVNFDQLC